jgi:hypothetical protein
MIIPVPASPVSRDMISSTELASSLPQTMLSPPTLDVEIGIGISKFVYLALTAGYLTPTMSVFQSLTNANLTIAPELVNLATKDTT